MTLALPLTPALTPTLTLILTLILARTAYIETLGRAEYRHLVRVERGRLALEDFLRLISEHQATLSPPGRGFDCFRTWQAR